MNVLLRSAAVLALAAAALATSAQVRLYDNLAEANGGTEVVGGNVAVAARFATGASPLFLTGVTLASTGPTGLGLSLYTQAANNPGTLVGALGPAVDAGGGLVSFNGFGLPLLANAQYWIVARNPTAIATNTDTEWSFTPSDANAGSTPAAAYAYRRSFDGGATFSGGGDGPGSLPMRFSVLAFAPSPVPEPSALAALSLSAVALVKRRRKA